LAAVLVTISMALDTVSAEKRSVLTTSVGSGPTAWAVNDGVTSPYTTQMFA